MSRYSTPAAVIGHGLNALGVVRSLAMTGVPVWVVGSHMEGSAMRSRYGRKLLVKQTEGEEFIETLCRQVPTGTVLFLTEEATVRTISQYRDVIQEKFRVRLPPHHVLMDLMHKERFQRLADGYGAPIGAAVWLRNINDLQHLNTLTFPCVVKPTIKDYTYGAQFKKGYVVKTSDEVEELAHLILPVARELLVQEWIEGGDSEVYFCLQYVGEKGETIISFTGQKIRSWPPRIGGTASCTAAWEVADHLRQLTESFFQRTGFVGMGSMEFKRDARNGNFYMIEPTVARTDFQEEVATINGVNIPLYAFLYELGLPRSTVTERGPTRVWREPSIDKWSKELQGDNEIFKNLEVVDAYWRLEDPGPWWGMFKDKVRSWVHHRLKQKQSNSG